MPLGAPALSGEQRQAVAHRSGALLVFAGPGSGKTRTLTARIGALLADGRAQAHEVLALTFTVRASEEMRVRLTSLVGQHVAVGVTVTTFHGLCARIMRVHARVFGRSPSFSIYDAEDLARVLRDVLAQRATGDAADDDAKALLARIAIAKSRLWTPAQARERWRDADGARIADIWEAVERELRQSDAFDFADLVTNAVALLSDHPRARAQYRRHFRHVVVDEFQDTDPAQFALLERLAGPGGGAPGGSLVVTGDDDQLLYGWRGAELDNLLEFRRAYPCATELVLRRNHRCRPEILDAAMRCIAHNERRLPKALIAARSAGGRVSVARFANDHHEAASVTREISELIVGARDPREILVLCRSLRFTGPLQHALTAAGIAHRVIGAHSLWERVEVLDALAYVALVANPYDGAAFRRAVAAPSDRTQFAKAKRRAPSRGVGAVTQRAIIQHARDAGTDLIDACAAAVELTGGSHPYVATSAAREALVSFGEQLADVRREHAQGGHVAKAVIGALMITGGPVACYDELLESTDDAHVAADCARVKEDLRSLCRAAHSYEARHGADASLVGFLEQARVEPATTLTAEEDTRLTISTIHGAKGTEAEVVFVLGCEERLLPTGYAIDSAQRLRIEEERRLFYVAATRAKDRLTLTRAAERLGTPTRGSSRFLGEAGQ
ncbi:MAG: ATP-dependent helicase [Actinomycetota bacterium]|nr:ATP-dependent helicase [Actinomycetota bacterium]